MSRGWIGVDLDGTLAIYDSWGDGSVGAPIPEMVARVKTWLARGCEVRIMTARVSSMASEREVADQVAKISAWCQKHLGQVLVVTAEKDFSMRVLIDDRAIHASKNTGAITPDWSPDSVHP